MMADHDQAFLVMCKKGETEKVRMALVNGANGNAADNGGWTALMKAASRGHVAVVELLILRPDVDANAADNGGWTALMLAAHRGHLAVVELLIQRPGVDANAANNNGRTALMLASREGHLAVVELLIQQQNVEVNAADNGGRTALHFAAVNGNNDVLNSLHNHLGIDLAAVTKEGETALHLLAKNHWDADPDILRNMLNNPAVDPNARDLQDRTPIMILLHDEDEYEDVEMLQVLVDNDRVDVEHEGLEDLAR